MWLYLQTTLEITLNTYIYLCTESIGMKCPIKMCSAYGRLWQHINLYAVTCIIGGEIKICSTICVITWRMRQVGRCVLYIYTMYWFHSYEVAYGDVSCLRQACTKYILTCIIGGKIKKCSNNCAFYLLYDFKTWISCYISRIWLEGKFQNIQINVILHGGRAWLHVLCIYLT